MGKPEEFVLVAELVVNGELHHPEHTLFVSFAQQGSAVTHICNVEFALVNCKKTAFKIYWTI